MEIKVIEKMKITTFEDLKVGDYFILLQNDDLVIKLLNIEENGFEKNAYSLKDNYFYDLCDSALVKKVNIKEIIVEEI